MILIAWTWSKTTAFLTSGAHKERRIRSLTTSCISAFTGEHDESTYSGSTETTARPFTASN